MAAIAFQLWVFGRWAADGGFRAVASSGYEISSGRAAVTWAAQIAIGLTALVLGVVLVRSAWRARQVTLNLALFAGFMLSFWQSPLFNYEQRAIVLNRYALNVATWGPYIPGWNSPAPQAQAESLLGLSGASFGLLLFWPWAQDWVTRRIAEWRPGWSWGRLLPVSLAAGVVTAALIEVIWMNTGLYAYATPLRGLTLFAGHWYGLPLLFPVVAALLIATPVVVLRHYARLHGTEVYLFRGSERLGRRTGQTLRLLSGVGLANIQLLCYFAANVLIAHALGGSTPTDMPSYLWPGSPR
ncbi:spirocyclase AveC family protein [Embleya sp. AB8]|uniref:spirocyclase AveC family protein n=1 Tax=Embleya sp. AB8 TaxID=3156304 RepID=UPI003C789378